MRDFFLKPWASNATFVVLFVAIELADYFEKFSVWHGLAALAVATFVGTFVVEFLALVVFPPKGGVR